MHFAHSIYLCQLTPRSRELRSHDSPTAPDITVIDNPSATHAMSAEALNESAELSDGAKKGNHQRKLVNAFWEPFQQFKLLMWMLGSTAVVAVLLAAFLYVAFSDLIGAVTVNDESRSYYADMIEMQLIHLFRYCAALFFLYILLLACVCVAYTHRMIGPFQPFKRHVDELLDGNYSSRVVLRKNDLQVFDDFSSKLNQLAVNMDLASNGKRSD